jgi:hypothetical protein
LTHRHDRRLPGLRIVSVSSIRSVVGIITTEPGGIEADDVDRKLPTEKQYELPRSEFRWLDHGALQLVLDPGSIVLLPLEDGAFPGVLEAKRGRMTHAIHPA